MKNLILHLFTAISMGLTLNNLNSDIIKQYYMRLFDITFIQADLQIQLLLPILTSISLIFFILSSALLPFILQIISQRNCTIICSFMSAVTNFLCAIPVSEVYLLIMRGLNGFFISTFCNLNLIIISNQNLNNQSLLGSIYCVVLCFGIVLTSIILLIIRYVEINYQLNIYYVNFIVSGLFPLLCFIISLFLQRDQKVSQQVKKESILCKKYFKMLIVSSLLGAQQQVCGINAVQNYATETFKNTFNTQLSSVYGSLLINTINFLSTFLSLFFKKFNKKYMLNLSILAVIITQTLFIVNYTVKQRNSTLLIVTSVVFILVFELGPGPLFWSYMAELFPENVKDQLVSVGVFSNYIINLIIVYLFPILTSINSWLPFATYLASTFVISLVLLFILPQNPFKIKSTNIEEEYQVSNI